jgi:hypothetical protein
MSAYEIPDPSFALAELQGPRGAIPQSQATRLKTTGTGLTIETDSSGRVDSGHPIDQGVVLSLTIQLKSIKSAPKIGNTLHEVDPVSKSIANDIRQRVLRAFPLSRYLDEGKVQIVLIEHEVRPHGGLFVGVSYKNLVTGKNERATN